MDELSTILSGQSFQAFEAMMVTTSSRPVLPLDHHKPTSDSNLQTQGPPMTSEKRSMVSVSQTAAALAPPPTSLMGRLLQGPSISSSSQPLPSTVVSGVDSVSASPRLSSAELPLRYNAIPLLSRHDLPEHAKRRVSAPAGHVLLFYVAFLKLFWGFCYFAMESMNGINKWNT